MATPKKRPDGADAVRAYARGLRNLPDEYIECRDVRHAWRTSVDFHVVPGQSEGRRKITYIDRVLGCSRCPCTRTQHFKQGRYGLEKISNDSYWRPKDYAVPGVPRGVNASIVTQQEAYRRALQRATGAQPGDKSTPER